MNYKGCLGPAIMISMVLCVQLTFAVSSPAKVAGQKQAKQKKKARKKEKGLFCGTPFITWTTNADSELIVENKTLDAVLGEAIRKVYPGYPSEARVARVEGNVIVEAIISKTGEVAAIKSASGPPALVKASTEAAVGWRFTATTEEGEPVGALAKITFSYNLGLDKEKAPSNEKRVQR
jgi:TonB family protein